MDWYSARIADPVAMRALMEALNDEVRRARVAARLSPRAQVYVVTEADAVRFHFNGDALLVCPSLQRFGLSAQPPPAPNECTNPLIDPRPGTR